MIIYKDGLDTWAILRQEISPKVRKSEQHSISTLPYTTFLLSSQKAREFTQGKPIQQGRSLRRNSTKAKREGGKAAYNNTETQRGRATSDSAPLFKQSSFTC